jgi:hypothetical protein
MYRRRPSAALVLSRASLPRTSWVELKLRDKIKNFEKEVSIRYNTNRFTILLLGDNSINSSLVNTSQLSELDYGK